MGGDLVRSGVLMRKANPIGRVSAGRRIALRLLVAVS
jgi:hypothetical protein